MCKEPNAYITGIEGAKMHRKVSHYTTFDSLKCILENHSLRLSRLDLVNDAYEEKRTDDLWKGKIFIACFTYRKTESNMFWNLYAKDNGVMLTFDNTCFCNNFIDVYADPKCKIAFKKLEKSDTNYNRNIDYSDWQLSDVTYADVTYTNDFNEYITVNTDLKAYFKGCNMVGKNKDFSLSLSPGLIKGIEWDSEQEVRIRAALSYRGLSKSMITGFPRTPFNYIYISIADALKTMSVTMNPWHCDCFENKLNDLIRNNPFTEKCEILESTMRDQVER